MLILWLATAAAGLTLLRAGRPPAKARAPAGAPVSLPVRIGAAPLTAKGIPPKAPQPVVGRADAARTFLEFCHPALAAIGIAFWMMFTYIRYVPLAWIAFGILVTTLCLGLGWLTSNRRADRKQEAAGWSFPRRLIWVHGLVAGSSLVLTVLTAAIAIHS